MSRPELCSGAGHRSETPPRYNHSERPVVICITPCRIVDQQKAQVMKPLARLMTVREAADVLRVSERTLWTLTHSGELPAVRVGRSVRYDKGDLARWIASRKTA